eukprot:576053_1
MEGQQTSMRMHQPGYNPHYAYPPTAPPAHQNEPPSVQQYQHPMYQHKQAVQQTPVIVQPVVMQPVMQPVQTVGLPRGNKPCLTTCAYCRQTMITNVEKKAGVKFGLFCLATFYSGLCVFIPCFDCSFNHNHYCSRCQNLIKEDTGCGDDC